MSVDLWADTQPLRPPTQLRRTRRSCWSGCILLFMVVGCLGLIGAVYAMAPIRTNVLLLGIDRAEDGSALGRSDTIILMTVVPPKPYVGMLSIPRDLWVTVPGVGENRVNSAHFFAESQAAGRGPYAAMETVRQNFGVDVDYFVRIRFEGLQVIVEAMGGLEVQLDRPMSGYDAGIHQMSGDQALAFVRDREGTDDFFRMERGQLFLKSMMRQAINPLSWPRLPGVFVATVDSVDTNIPLWHMPRILLAVLRAGPDGIDNRVITRDMVFPFTTGGGAQVLGPNWDRINPLLLEMFGQ